MNYSYEGKYRGGSNFRIPFKDSCSKIVMENEDLSKFILLRLFLQARQKENKATSQYG